MVDIKYANAYSEVLEILKHISQEDYNKIPKRKIEVFKTNANVEYKFKYDPSKTLQEQNVSDDGQAIIGILFRDYWATPKQRGKIIAKQSYDRQKFEEEKRKIYNPDIIFKNKVQKQQELNSDCEFPIPIKEERLFTKIIKIFRSIFKR